MLELGHRGGTPGLRQELRFAKTVQRRQIVVDAPRFIVVAYGEIGELSKPSEVDRKFGIVARGVHEHMRQSDGDLARQKFVLAGKRRHAVDRDVALLTDQLVEQLRDLRHDGPLHDLVERSAGRRCGHTFDHMLQPTGANARPCEHPRHGISAHACALRVKRYSAQEQRERGYAANGVLSCHREVV